jgi:hypothetical protein
MDAICRAFFNAAYSAWLLVFSPINSLYSVIIKLFLIITTPIPDGPGFPRLAPSILIVNNSLTKNGISYIISDNTKYKLQLANHIHTHILGLLAL